MPEPADRQLSERPMNARQIAALVDRIDLSKFGIKFEIRLLGVVPGIPSYVELGIKMHVNSVDTGEPIVAGRMLSLAAPIDERRMVHAIRAFLHDMARHEIDECFEVDGVRVFDPHRK